MGKKELEIAINLWRKNIHKANEEPIFTPIRPSFLCQCVAQYGGTMLP